MPDSAAPQANTLAPRATLMTPPARDASRWGRLYGAAEALALVEYALAEPRLVVAVVASTAELLRLEAELAFFGDGRLPLHALPDWETLTYDRVSPHPDIVSERIRTLHALPSLERGILALTAPALMQRLPPRRFLERHSLVIATGDTLAPEPFRERLVEAGYRHVSQVEEHGEFAVRGAILDLYPMGSTRPFRIEFFDEEIETIRSFDPDTQRGLERHERIELVPAHEFPLNAEGIATFRNRWRNTFAAESRNASLYRDVSDGRAPAGIEYYLPLFFDGTATLFDYLPDDATLVQLDGALGALEEFWETTAERHEQRRHDLERPVLAPAALYLTPKEVETRIAGYRSIAAAHAEVEGASGASDTRTSAAAAGTGREGASGDAATGDARAGEAVNFASAAPGLYPIEARGERPLGALEGFLARFDGRVLLVAESLGRREALLDTLVGNRLATETVGGWQEFLASDRPLCLTTAPLERGLALPAVGIALVTEGQLTGNRVKRRERRRPTRDADAIIANLAELGIGDPVVHIDHGVGRYEGLTRIELDGVESEYLTLRYAGDDRLHVPVSSLHLISRYTGASEDTAPLHRLGSEAWQKARRKAAEKAYDIAAELLEIHARRAARKGHAYPVDRSDYAAFAAAFPFEETPDQQRAIEAVIDDLASERPMDRVVCGDVGFGKTEVAMRAAFVAVDAGRQVAVLVPTTLLARQHYRNFLDRFADWPVQIDSISRFETQREQREILSRLEAGKIDIIIGTHKLLGRDISYDDLGLVVVDEEHRFGVRHKEHMKALRAEVDLLTLTATPIPRTLSMGLAGLRDLSIIATPPQHRHAIKTFSGEWDELQIREACERELVRGGQIYFLHNEVQSIERIADEVRRIVPKARVRVAHGQMPESELERTMVDFYHQRFDVLVATTIIESGIDIPTANTILINRADKLGLAQLHQLRGRVGRSHHRAYAYLITPPRRSMTADAVKRLEAIESLEDLGVGFTLATHDLEIRGAGELLGDEQSGQIQAIGFALYSELLDRAVKALKAGELPDHDRPLARGTEVDLGRPALLPEDYVPDVHQRLVLYKRIASAPDTAALDELRVELIDRFGLLPEQTRALFETARLRQRCEALGIERLEMGDGGGRVVFAERPKVDPATVIRLIQREPRIYRFDSERTLRVSLPAGADEAAGASASAPAAAFVDALLDELMLNEAA